jgi:hypothetical protein
MRSTLSHSGKRFNGTHTAPEHPGKRRFDFDRRLFSSTGIQEAAYSSFAETS